MSWHFLGAHFRKLWVLIPAVTCLLCLPVAIAVYLAGGSRPSRPTRTPQGPVPVSETSLLVNAEQVLIRDCMRRQGFAYWPIPVSLAYPAVRFPYVISSVSWARRHGFSGALMPDIRRDPNQRYYSQLTAAQQTVYSDALVGSPGSPGVTTPLPTGGIDGHSADGCQATADAELYGNYPAWFKANTVALYLPRSGSRWCSATGVTAGP